MQADYSEIEKLEKIYMAKNKELGEMVDSLPELAEAKAQSKMEYEKAVTVETLRLEEGKEHSITLIPNLVKGKVAEKKMMASIHKANYKACYAKIKALHTNIDTCQSLLSTARAKINLR